MVAGPWPRGTGREPAPPSRPPWRKGRLQWPRKGWGEPSGGSRTSMGPSPGSSRRTPGSAHGGTRRSRPRSPSGSPASTRPSMGTPPPQVAGTRGPRDCCGVPTPGSSTVGWPSLERSARMSRPRFAETPRRRWRSPGASAIRTSRRRRWRGWATRRSRPARWRPALRRSMRRWRPPPRRRRPEPGNDQGRHMRRRGGLRARGGLAAGRAVGTGG